jgi:hypothetical protein
MRLTVSEQEVLDLATEDYYGLWEVSWRLATVSEDESRDSSQESADVVRCLWGRGLIDLYTQAGDDSEPVLVERSSSDIDLLAEDWWRPQQAGEPRVLIAATESGRTVLAREGRWD